MKRLCILLIALSIFGCNNKESLFEPGITVPGGSNPPPAPAPVPVPTPRPSATEYRYVIGTDLLATLNGPNADPVRSTASSNGDSILIRGEGTFSIKPSARGKVTGRGTFVHKNAAGRVLASGTWKAEKFLSFESYGDGTPQGKPSTYEGGLALIQIDMDDLEGDDDSLDHGEPDPILRVQSLLGHPPVGAHEGVTIEAGRGMTFDRIVSGSTVFIRTN